MERTKSRTPRVEEPFERLDDDARAGDDHGARRAAVAAVVAAGAGALAGAVKTMLDSRARDEEPDRAAARDEGVEPEPGDEEQEPEAGKTDDETEARADDAEPDEQDEPEAETPLSPAHSFAATQERNVKEEPDDESEEDREQSDSESLRDADDARSGAAQVVPKAREQLEALIGREAESVSGIERRDGHWNVSLEVVEMKRVPETTDVLATYEVVLDDDGNVSRLRQTRRYMRSQTEADR